MFNEVHRQTGNVVQLPIAVRPVHKEPAQEEACSRTKETRYRTLLGEPGWFRLPAVVRERFARKLNDGETRVYKGEVVETKMNLIGRVLAHGARLVGGPLPLTPNAVGPATVIVTENAPLGAQTWTRIYAREGRFPQVITSAKRFKGTTGLEECLGHGLLMRLRLVEDQGALVFRSTGYAVELLGRTIPLPAWLAPGRCDVIHRDIGHDHFTFTLELHHKLFGLLVRQVAVFKEV